MRTLNLNVPILYDFLVLNNLCFPYPKLLRHSKCTLDEYNIKVENDVLQKNGFIWTKQKAMSLRKVLQTIAKLWLLFTLTWEVLQNKSK